MAKRKATISATAAGAALNRREINEEVGEFIMIAYCTLMQPAEQMDSRFRGSEEMIL
jgi:hypothetical protein